MIPSVHPLSFPSVYDSKETNFTYNGHVVLNDCISGTIEERLNDLYELTLEYPLDDRKKWEYLIKDNIIKSEGQPFRIYHRERTLKGVQINARHIFYDLLDNFIENLSIIDNCDNVLTAILDNTQYSHNFMPFCPNATSNKSFNFREINPVVAIMGEGGLLETYKLDILRDTNNITIMDRNHNNGVLISYGKNLLEIEESEDTSQVYTRLYIKGKDGLLLPEKYIDSPLISNYYNPKISVVEFNNIDNVDDLRLAGQNYFTTSLCDVPLLNYKINLIELAKTEEYKNYKVLESIHIGDTVIVRHRRLNLDIQCRIIYTKKNIITHKIEEIELGNFKPNLATTTLSKIR